MTNLYSKNRKLCLKCIFICRKPNDVFKGNAVPLHPKKVRFNSQT
jgi:hypothetical protein